MRTLASETKDLLQTALTDVCSAVEGGSSPNQAIVKVARDKNIDHSLIHLLCQSYNIAQSESTRRAGASLLEKTSVFPLADVSEIRKELYPSKSALDKNIPDSGFYDIPFREHQVNSGHGQEEPDFKANIKVASSLFPVRTPAAKSFHEHVSNTVREAQAHVKHRAADTERWRHVHATQLKKAAYYLFKDTTTHITNVKADLSAVFGQAGDEVVSALTKSFPGLEKLAAPQQVGSTQRYHELFESAITASRSVAMCEEFEKQAQEELATLEVIRDSKFSSAPINPMGVLPGNQEKLAFLGATLGAAAVSSFGRTLGDKIMPDPAKAQDKVMASITDPQQEASIRNIQTQYLINDMLANDPVISSHHPNQVIDAFNTISEISPRMSTAGALMKAMVRKQLTQGSLDPYDIDLLLKMDQNLKKRDTNYGVMGGSQDEK